MRMNSKDSQSFGQLIRERRLLLDMTQEELAQRAGCATISARRIEAGTLRPSTQLAEQLSEVLEISDEERDAFIKLARAVSYKNDSVKENSEPSDLPVEQGIDTRMWRHTEHLLTWLPLMFLVIIVVINPRYMGILVAIEPPFLLDNIVPTGWLVFILVFALMAATRIILQNSRRATGNRQIYYRPGLNGFVLLFLILPAVLLLLLVPALFQLLRSGAFF